MDTKKIFSRGGKRQFFQGMAKRIFLGDSGELTVVLTVVCVLTVVKFHFANWTAGEKHFSNIFLREKYFFKR